MEENNICRNCLHEKEFHDLDSKGRCVHGLVISDELIDTSNQCKCDKFVNDMTGEQNE